MQRRLDLAWNLVRCVQVCRQVLVRELTAASDRVRVSQSAGHVVDHRVVGSCESEDSRLLECVVTQQCVEVHSQCLRSHLSGDCLPNERTLRHVGQQVPTNLQVTRDQRLCLSRVGGPVRDQ